MIQDADVVQIGADPLGDRLLRAGDQESLIRHLYEHADAALANMSPGQLVALERLARTTLAARDGTGCMIPSKQNWATEAAARQSEDLATTPENMIVPEL